MLSYHWGWVWHEGCGPSFLSGRFLQKRCHYLTLCHPLVYIISISPNHVYMINHLVLTSIFTILIKMIYNILNLFWHTSFFSSTSILHEGLKIKFNFSKFLYYAHKNNGEKTTHDERSYEMLMFWPMHSLIPFMFHKNWEIHLLSKVWRRCAFCTVPTWFIEHPSPSSFFESFVRLIHISFVSNDLFLTFWPL